MQVAAFLHEASPTYSIMLEKFFFTLSFIHAYFFLFHSIMHGILFNMVNNNIMSY